MRYYALATDYDGTLAHNGKVDDGTYAALERLRTTRRKLILVTGRRLDDLMTVFDRIEIFDRVVAENGALVYNPAARGGRAGRRRSRDRRDLVAARDDRARHLARDGSRTPHHLQQGRGHGLAAQRQQGQRSASGARRSRAVGAQRRRRR